MRQELYLPAYTKLSSTWIKDLNIKIKPEEKKQANKQKAFGFSIGSLGF